MAQYTNIELEMAGRQLAQTIQQLNAKIEALESKPAVDDMNQRWYSGRQMARDKGYDDQGVQDLEEYMVNRGISHHEDAIRLSPVRPTNLVFGGLEDRDLLFANPDAWADRQIAKAASGR